MDGLRDRASEPVGARTSRVIGVIALLAHGAVTVFPADSDVARPEYAFEVLLLCLCGAAALAFVKGMVRAWAVVVVLAFVAFFAMRVLDGGLLLGVPGLVGCGAILAIVLGPPEAKKAAVEVPGGEEPDESKAP